MALSQLLSDRRGYNPHPARNLHHELIKVLSATKNVRIPSAGCQVSISNVTVVPPTTRPIKCLSRHTPYVGSLRFDLTIHGEKEEPFTMPHSIHFPVPVFSELCSYTNGIQPAEHLAPLLEGFFVTRRLRAAPMVIHPAHNLILTVDGTVEARCAHAGDAGKYRSTSTIAIYKGTIPMSRSRSDTEHMIMSIPFLKARPPVLAVMMTLGFDRAQALSFFESPACASILDPDSGAMERMRHSLTSLQSCDDAREYMAGLYDVKVPLKTVVETIQKEVAAHLADMKDKCLFLAYMTAKAMSHFVTMARGDLAFSEVFNGCDQLASMCRMMMRSGPTSLTSIVAGSRKNGARKKVDLTRLSSHLVRVTNSGKFSERRTSVTMAVMPMSQYELIMYGSRVDSDCIGTNGAHVDRRLIHKSHVGRLCIVETPDNKDVLLRKSAARYTCVSEEDPYAFDVIKKHVEFDASGMAVFAPDGSIAGVTKNPMNIVRVVRDLRRSGCISPFVSVYVFDGATYIRSNAGRLMRPLVIAGAAEPEFPVLSIEGYIANGIFEYLDAAEEQYTDVIIGETHLEVSETAHVGLMAAIEPKRNFQQPARSTFQAHMRRAATTADPTMGLLGVRSADVFSVGQKPMVTTAAAHEIGLDDVPSGFNAVLAIFPGDDAVEDCLEIRKSVVERLGGVASETHYHLPAEPDSEFVKPDGRVPSTREEYAHIMENGLIAVGTQVKNRDILATKIVKRAAPPADKADVDDSRAVSRFRLTTIAASLPYNVTGRVTKAYIDGTGAHVSVLYFSPIRDGSKGMLAGGGQKGVFRVKSDLEFPFDDEGGMPDILMNPEGWPSRVSVGALYQLLMGMAAAVTGMNFDDPQTLATHRSDMERAQEALKSHGFFFDGTTTYRNPETGDYYRNPDGNPTRFARGVIHISLLHAYDAADKLSARNGGAVNYYRQTPNGRTKLGGFRSDFLTNLAHHAHGASEMLRSLMCDSADHFDVFFCKTCGNKALGNDAIGYYFCDYCRSSENIVRVPMTFSVNFANGDLQGIGVYPRVELEVTGPDPKRRKISS